MRFQQLFLPVLMIFTATTLILTGCDTREEKVEYVPPVEGALLEGGEIPAITPEGAAEIKKMIEDISLIKQYSTMFEDEEIGEKLENIEIKGALKVYPREEHYEVKFPERIRVNADDDDSFETIEFYNNIGLIVRPTGDPAAFRVEFITGEKPFYAIVNKGGEQTEFMNFSFASVTGIKALWHKDLQMFTQMNGNVRNVTLDVNIPEEYREDYDNIDAFQVVLSDVNLAANMEPDDNNLWSGPYNATLGQILITLPQKVGTVNISEFLIKQSLEKLNPEAYRAFFKEYNTLMASAMQGEEKPNAQNKDMDFLSFTKAYKDLYVNGYERGDIDVKMSELTAKLNNTPDDPSKVKDFGIEEISIKSGLDTTDKNASDFNLSYTIKGIDVGMKQFDEEFGGETPQELVPENFSFGLSMDDFPAESFMDHVISLIENAETTETKPEKIFMDHYGDFVNLLAKSDTKLKINDSYVGNDIWLLLVNGIGRMNLDAKMKVEGETEVRFYGMDYLMQVMDQRSKSENTPAKVRQMMQNYTAGLGMMQMFGQQKKDDNNRDYRGYTITLTPEGQVQMNGTDMSQMMGLMGR